MLFDHIITSSPSMQAALGSARLIAATDANMLITGESGTGKDVVARAIHEASPRRQAPFIAVNCASLPEALAESLLFGHRKGAFTGAESTQPGMIQSADTGTLFLDEIGELSAPLQAKLLRFLESGEVLPLGEVHSRRVNVRVLAATHRDLYQLANAGHFRSDLYYRLNVVPLLLPALRERSEDIELLAKHFLHEFACHHRLEPARLRHDALRLLQLHAWPGNIRELKNTCERLSILLCGQEITASNLSCALRTPDRHPSIDPSRPFPLPPHGLNLEALERDLLEQALIRTKQNKTHAANLLGITRDAFNYRLKKHALA